MNKTETYEFLKKENIDFEVTEHRAVYNMAELAEVEMPYPECDAKNLFVRDDKRRDYYLITIKGDKRVDLKAFRREMGTRPLTFASAEELFEILGLTPGAVTPLGLLCDDSHRVTFYIDSEFCDAPGIIGVHPNDNTATVWLKTADLLRVIGEHGNTVHIVGIHDSRKIAADE